MTQILSPEARAKIVEFYAQQKGGRIILDTEGNFRTIESPHTLSDLQVLKSALQETDMVNHRQCDLNGAMWKIFGTED